MSVIVVVRKGGKAVIAADTLTSAGYKLRPDRLVRNRSKIVSVEQGYVGVVGSMTHPLVLKSLVKHHHEDLDFTSVEHIFASLLSVQKTLTETYLVRTEESDSTQEYDSNQLDLLFCNPHGIFGAQSYREVTEFGQFWANGSGDEVALGAMHALYDRLDDPVAIATAAVEAACELQQGCGLPMHVRTVDLL